MSKIIVLDPGHGGNDPGAVHKGRQEKDDNLRLAFAVEKLLTARGHVVELTRTDDSFVSLHYRTALANKTKANLFVSLHRNSFTTPDANGAEIWLYTTAGAAEVGLSAEVLEQLATVGLQQNRGVKKGNYHVLRETDMASMLVELGFISNEMDNILFDRNFDAYATAIAKGICLGLGAGWEVPDQVSPRLYRVQMGAFSNRSNAEAFLQTVQNMGLSAFLVTRELSTEERYTHIV